MDNTEMNGIRRHHSEDIQTQNKYVKSAVQYLAEVEKTHRQKSDLIQAERTMTFSNFEQFVPIGLKEPLYPANNKSNKAYMYMMIAVAVWILIAVTTFPAVMEMLDMGFIVTLAIYIILTIATLVIILKKVFDLDKERESSARIDGNKSISKKDIWGITSGGIKSIELLDKNAINVYYKGQKAIVFKLLKKSTLSTQINTDWIHFKALKDIETILCTDNKWSYTKINSRYSTDNDEIWEYWDKSLESNGQIFGNNYTEMMKEFYKFQHEKTSQKSIVTVVYLIIKPTFLNKNADFLTLYLELKERLKFARMEISPINSVEFINLIRDYYGFEYLDDKMISEYVINSIKDKIKVDILYTVDELGNLTTLTDNFEKKRKENPEVKSFRSYKKSDKNYKKANSLKDIINTFEETTSFGDKYIINETSDEQSLADTIEVNLFDDEVINFEEESFVDENLYFDDDILILE